MVDLRSDFYIAVQIEYVQKVPFSWKLYKYSYNNEMSIEHFTDISAYFTENEKYIYYLEASVFQNQYVVQKCESMKVTKAG